MTTSSVAAGHRSIIRRAMAKCEVPGDLQGMAHAELDAWAKANPRPIAQVLERWFERAANAWVEGNNSGNVSTLRQREADCDRIRAQAESVLSLYGVKVDYPGLYPRFLVNGRSYHTTSELSQCLDDPRVAMRPIRVHFDDGQSIETSINGTRREIEAYYIGQPFEYDETKPTHTATRVEFLEGGAK